MVRQRLGQHFLSNPGWQEKIARAIGISNDSSNFSIPGATKEHCWIEIGAGHGEMTRHLVATRQPVIAVELDPSLARRLSERATELPNLVVRHNDVLKTDLRELAVGRRVRIYGNLPYYITSPILHHFFEFADLIDEIHIVIQLEVAFRLVARPRTRDYGYLSVLTQYFSRPAIVLKIPRGAFRPPPEVGSALVSMPLPGEKKSAAISDEAKFFDFVKLCFAQKRKTLVNNLRTIAEPEETRELLAAAGLGAGTRAEELSVAQLAELFHKLEKLPK